MRVIGSENTFVSVCVQLIDQDKVFFDTPNNS